MGNLVKDTVKDFIFREYKDLQKIGADKFSFSEDIRDIPIYLNKTLQSIESKTTFYFIDAYIPQDKIKQQKAIHIKILSEDLADFYILPIESEEGVNYQIEYVRAEYTDTNKTLFKIPANTDDEELLSKIEKSNLDSGLFWFEMKSKLDKIKKTTIDKVLINRLRHLRKKLQEQYTIIFNAEKSKEKFTKEEVENKVNEYTQTLIDRTLFIKYLEDKKIVNSWYHGKYIDYKTILSNYDADALNELYKHVNNIFNNSLFDNPKIDNNYLKKEILQPILNTISGTDEYGQLSLFDLQFDLIPIETISLIYNIFLEENAPETGSYYTPKGLAQFIVNETIDKVAPTLDCSCGSGAFLIMAFRRMLELTQKDEYKNDIGEEIKRRNKILAENIYGIELQLAARRLSVFSVTLELLNGLDIKKLRNYISTGVKKKGDKFSLFNKKFHENIVCSNALLPNSEIPLKKKKFKYLVGNPPWKSDVKKVSPDYKYWENNQEIKGQQIFEGKNQLSQLFLHKIKDWATKNTTKFGFVVNSSNFQGENVFQNFFFSTYTVEKVYELSKLKDYLFDNAKEPATVLIFNNQQVDNNIITYSAPDLTDFTKQLNIVLLQNNKTIEIKQNTLWGKNKSDSLRNYLLGNINDRILVDKISKNQSVQKLSDLVFIDGKSKPFVRQGNTLYAVNFAKKLYGINKELKKKEKEELKKKYEKDNISPIKKNEFNIPFLSKQKSIESFKINEQHVDKYLSSTSKLRRAGKEENHTGKRIIVLFVGKINSLKSVYTEKDIRFSRDFYVIKLSDSKKYQLVNATLNSKIANYYIDMCHRKRVFGDKPKINIKDCLDIPIIKEDIIEKKHLAELNEVLLKKSININEINTIFFKLYNLNYFEKQRINDFYRDGNAQENDIIKYCETFIGVLNRFSKNDNEFIYEPPGMPEMEDFGIVVAKIVKSDKIDENPNTKKTGRYLLNEILERAIDFNIFNLRERIYSEDTIYIIKDRNIQNWTITRAYEDVQDELKKHYQSK